MKKHVLAFAWAWFWFLIVGAGSMYFCLELTDVAASALAGVHWLSAFTQAKATSWAGWLLYWVGGGLFCWRFVKVLALQGSPFSFGMYVSWTSVDAATQPMRAYGSCIGDFNVFGTREDSPFHFLFGAVFRRHPKSDKLMRARLQFLTLAIWPGWSLQIVESRAGFFRQTHRARAECFRQHFDGLNNQKMSQFEKDALTRLNDIKSVITRLAPQ
ncbi:MAG: hypothetical protein OXG59_13825 [Gammaproteobacteria bacterium]|nr:hypothetical protein [Gammaproteobacteria bacterium]